MYLGSLPGRPATTWRGPGQEEALGLYRDLGSRLGQANAISELGAVRRRTGDYAGAARYQQEALDLYRYLGDRGGEAMALCELGAVRRQTGDYDGAARRSSGRTPLLRDLGDEAEVLNELGALYRVRGDLDRARACHQQALDQARSDENAEMRRRTGRPGPLRVAAGQRPTQRPAWNGRLESSGGSVRPRRSRSPPRSPPSPGVIRDR